VVNFFETFSTHYFQSSKQDPMVGSSKNKVQFMRVALKVAVLKYSFLEYSQGILEIKLCFKIDFTKIYDNPRIISGRVFNGLIGFQVGT
jgi:hypothetical protein